MTHQQRQQYEQPVPDGFLDGRGFRFLLAISRVRVLLRYSRRLLARRTRGAKLDPLPDAVAVAKKHREGVTA